MCQGFRLIKISCYKMKSYITNGNLQPIHTYTPDLLGVPMVIDPNVVIKLENAQSINTTDIYGDVLKSIIKLVRSSASGLVSQLDGFMPSGIVKIYEGKKYVANVSIDGNDTRTFNSRGYNKRVKAWLSRYPFTKCLMSHSSVIPTGVVMVLINLLIKVTV